MIKHIDLFLPPRSHYQVLHHFTETFADALRKSGVRCRILEAQRDNPKPFLDALFQNPPDCTLSFNGLLPDEDGRFFADTIGIPHVACLVDSPNHFVSLTKSPLTIVTAVDRFYVDFFEGLKFSRALFMPHGVEKDLEPNTSVEKVYDVLMLSSFIDYEAIRESWKSQYRPFLRDALENASDLAISDKSVSYVEAFVKALNEQKAKFPDLDPAHIDFITVLDELETYINGKDRLELVKSIKNAHVHIFGSSTEGWKKALGTSCPNVTIHEPVPYKQALELMQKSKIVLNSKPTVKNGSHERVFAGLASGALPLTSQSLYLEEFFEDGKNIAFYHPGFLDTVSDKVDQYLSNDQQRQALIEEGYEIVKNNHTWDTRAAVLLHELAPILDRIKP